MDDNIKYLIKTSGCKSHEKGYIVLLVDGKKFYPAWIKDESRLEGRYHILHQGQMGFNGWEKSKRRSLLASMLREEKDENYRSRYFTVLFENVRLLRCKLIDNYDWRFAWMKTELMDI